MEAGWWESRRLARALVRRLSQELMEQNGGSGEGLMHLYQSRSRGLRREDAVLKISLRNGGISCAEKQR